VFPYDGSQLRSLFAYLGHGVQGDSIVAWQGPCQIPLAHMVDGEDLLANAEIRGDLMLHFIVEVFGRDLYTGVALQRLLSAIAGETLQNLAGRTLSKTLCRSGDDLYFGDGKLSISIASVTPISAMIHFAVNITNQGTPVQTACLQDLHIETLAFAKKLMQNFVEEIESLKAATTKVRPLN